METKYTQLANTIRNEIRMGVYTEGQKIPSLRMIQALKSCSLTTAKEAYRILFEEGLVEIREKSGYYVRKNLSLSKFYLKNEIYDDYKADDRIQKIVKDMMNPDLIQLGSAILNESYLPIKQILMSFKNTLRREYIFNYGDLLGVAELRKKISHLLIKNDLNISEKNIQITNGCTAALSYALLDLCEKGDAVIVPSPTYMGAYQILETLNLKVIELPYRTKGEIDLFELISICKKFRPKAMLVSSNFNNPTGTSLTENQKIEISEILIQFKVSLIEDDIYGDLYFENRRPRPMLYYYDLKKKEVGQAKKNECKSYYASSFSKQLSPGLRIGYLASQTSISSVEKISRAINLSLNLVNQWTVYDYLVRHSFEKYLHKLRLKLQTNVKKFESFLELSNKVSTGYQSPKGGFVLWIPTRRDSNKVFEEARKYGIAIAPGRLFGISDQWKYFVRINAGLPWGNKLEKKLEILRDLL